MEIELHHIAPESMLFSKMSDEVWCKLGPGGEVQYLNAVWQRLLPEPLQNYIGKPFHNLFGSNEPIDVQTVQAGKLTVVNQPATRYAIRWKRVRIKNGSKYAIGCYFPLKAKERLYCTPKQARFLAEVGHEIRNPLTGILGMVNILSAELQNANTKEVMKMLETSTHNLYNLVTELLDFAKLELDVMKVEYKVVQLPKLFNELQAEYKLQAERKGIKLQIDYSNLRLTHPAGVYWMPEVRLRQVLTNLLSNAIKYTQKGRVTLKVGVVPFTKNTSNNLADTPQKHISALPLPKVLENNYQIGEQVVLEFRVIDTGIGLAEENLEKVFEPFFKLDSPKINKTKKLESGHEKGTGLGLAIVKEMAFRLGGKVYAENNPKKGTTFVFVLPVLPLFMNQLSPEELETQAIVAKTNGKSALYQNKYHDTHNKNTLNILLAEDDCINNLYLVTLLQKSGYAVTAVSNGIDAVEAFVRERFDLVFMDGNMPGYSGIEATQAIRNFERSNNKTPVPIVAITGYAMEDDQNRFLAAGMNAYITKPFNEEALFRTIKNLAPHTIVPHS